MNNYVYFGLILFAIPIVGYIGLKLYTFQKEENLKGGASQ